MIKLKTEPMDAYALFNRAEATLNSDLYSNSQTFGTRLHQLEQHNNNKQLIFPHLDIALQDLSRVLTINPHDTDARDLKNLLIERGYIRK